MNSLINYQIEELKNKHKEYFNKHIESDRKYKNYIFEKIYDNLLSIIIKIENDNTDFQLKNVSTEEYEEYSSMDAVLFHFDFFKEKYMIKYSIVDFLLDDNMPFYNKIIKEDSRKTSKLVSINNKLKLATKNNVDRKYFKKGILELLSTLIDTDKKMVSSLFFDYLEKNSNIIFFIKNDEELHIFIKNIILVVLLENIKLIIEKEENNEQDEIEFKKVDIKSYKQKRY